jgi:hypothetical protein
MKSRSALLVLVMSLSLGISGTAFATDPTPSSSATPTRADQVTAIQDQYNPLFDAEYARLLVLKKKALVDADLTKRVKAVLVDFLEVRRVIGSNLISSTSDLSATRDYAEEETGEFSSTISMLESQAAKIKTISCVKGKVVKKITAISPKCPKGYKKK